jgi:hypothetical protein
MEHFLVHSALGTYTFALLWGGLAAAASIFALLLVSETSSGGRPPGCQRRMRASKPAR